MPLFRRSLIILASLLGLIVLLLLIVFFLLTSERGSKFVWNTASKQLPELIQQGNFEGSFADNFSLTDLEITLPDLKVSAETIKLDWTPLDLIKRRLLIDQLYLDQIHIVDSRPPSPDSDEPVEIKNIDLPVELALNDFQLTDLIYEKVDQKKPIQVDHLHLAINTQENTIKLDELDFAMPEAKAKLQAALTPQGNYPTEATINWQLTLPDQPEIHGNGTINGDLKTLIISQEVNTPVSIRFNAKIHDLLEDLNWTASIHADQLAVQKLDPDAPDIQLNTDLKSEGSLNNIHLQGNLDLFSSEFGNWVNTLDVNLLDQAQLQINRLNVKSNELPTEIDLLGNVALKADAEFDLKGHWQALQWPLTSNNDQLTARSDEGQFSLSGSLNNYLIKLTSTVWTPQTDTLPIALSGQGDQQHFVLEKFKTTFSMGDFTSQGEVNWAHEPLQVKLDGDWSGIVINLPEQTLSSPKGRFQLDGDLNNYTVALNSRLEGDSIPNGNWQLTGEGSDQFFTIESLNSDILNGQFNLSGRVDWQPEVQWDINVNGKQLNPVDMASDWPGLLDIRSHIVGKLTENGPEAHINQTRIEGTLRDYIFNSEVNADVTPELAKINAFFIRSGRSQISAKGTVEQLSDLDLNIKIDSPNLAEFYPKAKGQLSAQAYVKGQVETPQITAKATGKKIQFEETYIDKLLADIDLNLAALTQQTDQKKNFSEKIQININAVQIALGDTQIQSFDLKGTGTIKSHQLTSKVQSDHGQLITELAGGLQETDSPSWLGQIKKLDLLNTQVGDWKLDQSSSIQASSEKATLEQLCLSQNKTQICSTADWNEKTGWQAALDLSKLQFTQFAEFLPPGMKAEGEVNLDAQLNGNKNIINGKVNLTTSEGQITVDDNNSNDTPSLHFAPSTAKLDLNNNGLNSELVFNIDQPTKSPVKANMQAPGFAPGRDLNKIPLKGSITSNIADLSFLETFTTELEEIKAKLNIDLQLAGTLAQPRLAGKTDLQGSLMIPRAGLHLQDMTLNAESDDQNRIKLTGEFNSGEGVLKLDGDVSPFSEGKPLNLSINGENVEIVNLPEALVLASPDLNISMRDQRVDVKGSVLIPEAEIQPVGIESAVGLSDDVVIIQEEKESKASPLAINADVNVKLGKKVRVSASGFSGKITGGIDTKMRPKKPVTGVGELNIVGGKFEAYGQALAISKGKILFTGGPIDSPTLELEAIRKAKGGVTAGVRVTGTPDSPQMTLFSTPTMNQDSILSYLMLGRPLSEASSSESALLLDAAKSVGFKGADMLTQSLGQGMGLDEFSIDGSGKEDAALQLGKYLTPKLYISYGVGLFDPVTQLKMRYDLGRRWALEAVSGANSSMDFLYKYEK